MEEIFPALGFVASSGCNELLGVTKRCVAPCALRERNPRLNPQDYPARYASPSLQHEFMTVAYRGILWEILEFPQPTPGVSQLAEETLKNFPQNAVVMNS